MKHKKKLISLVLAICCMLTLSSPVFAETKSKDTPYGTLTGVLEGTGGWLNNYGFKGTTKCSQRQRLYIGIEVRQNTSGEFENSDSKTSDSASSISLTVYGNDKKTKKAGYGKMA